MALTVFLPAGATLHQLNLQARHGLNAASGRTYSLTSAARLHGRLPLVTTWVTLFFVIKNFAHKGLERFFLTGSKAGIQAEHARKLQLILGRLHASAAPHDMNLPGLYLHELKGDRQGIWSVRVSGNWRVTFRFEGSDAVAVNYEDYH